MLPSIDKANRNPVPPKSNQVRQIDQTDKVHPRDYAYEMEQILEKEKHHQQQDHPFGEDTFEPSDETETEETGEETKPVPKDANDSSDHEQNIDIIV
ncbi:hypothetical protein KKC97_12415 [bacterium]|nr:hypothetical protein [bacterium]MBU1638460.1 hypothetical protein [bacterium]MBU1921591.1 hypothetical protein [bacterium]RQV95010.1 MAG: hypothetical protein EH220_06695 [bacterium]